MRAIVWSQHKHIISISTSLNYQSLKSISILIALSNLKSINIKSPYCLFSNDLQITI